MNILRILARFFVRVWLWNGNIEAKRQKKALLRRMRWTVGDCSKAGFTPEQKRYLLQHTKDPLILSAREIAVEYRLFEQRMGAV